MKNLGAFHYFLKIVVQRHKYALLLHQSTYLSNMINCTSMTNCILCPTPVHTNNILSSQSEKPYFDPRHQRSLTGALQYLTFTRPNISYVVQQICLHMLDQTHEHMIALKRIIRYVQGTPTLGITSQNPQLSKCGLTRTLTGRVPVTRGSTSRVLHLHL